MSTRTLSSRRPREDGAAKEGDAGKGTAPVPWNLMTDLGRQQLAVGAEAASVLFRGSEAIRKIQQQAAHEASLRHHAVLQKLQAGAAPADLVAVQEELLRFDVEQASWYWQKLTEVAVQTQVEMLGCAGRLVNDAAGNAAASRQERG